MYNNINRIIGLSCWKNGTISVVMSFEQECWDFLQRKTSFRQKAIEDKITNFCKESEY